MKKIIASCFIFCGISIAAHAADSSDTYLGYRYGTQFREPANSDNIQKNIISLTHFSKYKFGTNFFNVDMLSSDGKDPASGGGGGAQEVYTVYRTTLSLSSLGAPVSASIIRDIGVTGGFNFSAKDDQVARRLMSFSIGPKVSFEVPHFKYLDFAVLYRTEHDHDWYATQPPSNGSNGAYVSAAGFPCPTGHTCTNGDIYYDPTYALELAWSLPFDISIVPFNFKGYTTYIGPKGKDALGNDTKAETLLETALMVDVGSFAKQKGTFFVGPGYQFWNNKYGSDTSNDSSGGSKASVPQIEAEVHF